MAKYYMTLKGDSVVRIYALNIKDGIDIADRNNLLHLVSAETQNRIQHFRFHDDAKRTLYGEAVIRWLASACLGLNNDAINIAKKDFGKPYIQGYPGFNFNISHSGDWVVCATACQKVGIDIELIKDIDLNVAKCFFSEEEYSNLTSKANDEKISYFYDLWTAKESYIKYLGKGISIPLRSFTVENISQTRFMVKGCESIIQQYIFEPGYKLAVCTNDYSFLEKILQLSVKDIALQLSARSKK